MFAHTEGGTKLRMYENRVLRKILRLKGEEETKKPSKNEIRPRAKQKILQQKNTTKEERRVLGISSNIST